MIVKRTVLAAVCAALATLFGVASAVFSLCWDHVELDCCSLHSGYKLTCGSYPPGPVWRCEGETLTPLPDVGTWVIRANGPYGEGNNTSYVLFDCQYRAPACGSEPGACTLVPGSQGLVDVVCRDYDPPGLGQQLCPGGP